jgi:hypothetical protein
MFAVRPHVQGQAVRICACRDWTVAACADKAEAHAMSRIVGECVVRDKFGFGEIREHCWHETGGTTLGNGRAGTTTMLCCYCGQTLVRDWKAVPHPDHGPFYPGRLRQYTDLAARTPDDISAAAHAFVDAILDRPGGGIMP